MSRHSSLQRLHRAVSGWWPPLLAAAFILIALSAGSGALPPPADRFDHGAAGTARNGTGGEIAPSPSIASWPGTGNSGNGGPFGFVGAQYGSLWNLPSGPNNSLGVGYCVMEDVLGTGRVTRQPDPAAWDAGEMARAAAVMATYGGDRVVPYGVDRDGAYDVATGEWRHPGLFGGGEYTRRRQVAVNFAVRMFLEDVSPAGAARGRKLARDTSVVRGSGGDFAALREGYRVAQQMAAAADIQAAVGGLRLEMVWGTPGGIAPTSPGRYALEVHVRDGNGKPVGWVPVLQLSSIGIETNRSAGAIARVDNGSDAPGDRARWNAATATGWPIWGMQFPLSGDDRFMISQPAGISAGDASASADVADARGVADFEVTITDAEWELAFHAQAPTADVELWAGTGLQGQVTWAGRPQSASVHQRHEVPERHVVVEKTSSDPAVSVAGTQIALLDGSGDEVARAVVDDTGRAPLPPIDPTEHEPPFSLRELDAAPGLVARREPIPLPSLDQLSTDARRPTVITVENRAAVGQLVVRKVLDADDVAAGRDLSDFEFRIVRLADGSEIASVTTDAEGTTPAIDVVFGRYRIEEVARPPWAQGLIDTGPIEVDVDPTQPNSTSVVVDYVNRVPPVAIDTRARDAADGDQHLDADGATVIDTVELCGLVPGTSYIAHGQLMQLGHEEIAPTGAVGSAAFIADEPCASIEVEIPVPPGVGADLAGGAAVVFQRVAVAGSDRTVAEHVNPADVDQTVYVPSVTTSLRHALVTSGDDQTDSSGSSGTGATPSAASNRPQAAMFVRPGDPLADHATFAGLAPGRDYVAEMTLLERHADGSCSPTDVVIARSFATESLHPAAADGTVIVDGFDVPHAGVFVATQRVTSADGVVVASHDDCDDRAQTVWAIGIDTAVERSEVVGSGTMVDRITVSGLADGVPDGAIATVEGALHRHDEADRSTWVCDDNTRIATFQLPAPTDGTYHSPGESHGLGWYSYDVRIVITFADGTTWAGDWHGCLDAAESFHAAAPPTTSPPASTPASTSPPSPASRTPPSTTPASTTTTTTAAPPPATDPAPPRPLPSTGNPTIGGILVPALILCAGGATLLFVARRLRFAARSVPEGVHQRHR